MESIDKLRAYAKVSWSPWSEARDHMNRMLDDVEQEASDMRGFCERLEEAAEGREEIEVFGVAYMPLPLDADGEPINMGDVLAEHEDGHTFKVDGFKIWGQTSEWWVYQEGGIQAPATNCTHHKPTVEDVLREFGDWYAHTKGGCDEEGIVAKYAAKLRMAEGD